MLRWKTLKTKARRLFRVFSRRFYLFASISISIIFLIALFIYGSLLLGIKIGLIDYLSVVLGGVIISLLTVLTPYMIGEAKKKIKKRKRRRKNYPIQLITSNPPEIDKAKLEYQAKKIENIIKDLNKICIECISKKCGKCRIKQEITPTLNKLIKSLKD